VNDYGILMTLFAMNGITALLGFWIGKRHERSHWYEALNRGYIRKN
jgi:hypothetical protein